MIILVDVDGVLADIVGLLCTLLNEAGVSPDKVFPEDFTHYDFDKCLMKVEMQSVREWMRRPGFASYIPWYPGAKEFVRELHTLGDVVAVTRPYPTSTTWAHERAEWLKGHVDKVIHTEHKEYVWGDFLIEDSQENCKRWEKSIGGVSILMDRPWCRNVGSGQFIAKTYDAVLRLVRARFPRLS